MPITTAIRLLIHGAKGRMGARVVSVASADARYEIVASVDRDDAAITDKLSTGSINAIIDFSSDAGAQCAVKLALRHHAVLLVGTTGLSPKSLGIIEEAARSVPVMIAPNTSLGVAVVSHLAIEAGQRLGSDYHVDLIETHHVMKKDAPSGTALRLAQELREAGIDLPSDQIRSIRQGDVIGEHTIQFTGLGETVTIIHTATNRDLFAIGALRAVVWLHGRPPGMYSIDQSLGLNRV